VFRALPKPLSCVRQCYGRKFRSVAEARAAVRDAVAFYNNERPHMSIGMMTPAEAANCTGEL